ncbi:sarcosine oxidase subunit gamma [Acuticoccus sediminis]|uniref:Sarcosine oxidase subunit gamma n=1 Tax=Acuticoccus sediminis TaxID=2184697 RepID=A0A8B2NLX4_9HYPH|nr:sarcosine oxidase subunit gamma [Acuticoccus sediminis]RAH98814.1 sarcosine oxidase subunit gamma [Acuticoccus sediminis]
MDEPVKTMSTTVEALPARARFSLRATEADAAAAGEALAVPLGATIGEIAVAGDRRSLRLGPDEWVVVAPLEDAAPMAGAFAASGIAGSLVEISNREVSFAVSGPAAEDLLAHGCPRDLSRMAPGRGARTVFDGLSVVLWHVEDGFEVDVWRSYAPFLEALLTAAQRELAVTV